MESTAIFEVELSVTFIRCRPDSIHMLSVQFAGKKLSIYYLHCCPENKMFLKPSGEPALVIMSLFFHYLLTPQLLMPLTNVCEQDS